MTGIHMDKFCQYFEAAIPELKQRMMLDFSKGHKIVDYRLVWGHFESVVIRILVDFLQQPPFKIPKKDIIQPSSKSKYPDLKVLFEGEQYAIDVKSGYDTKRDPWYDMGRLDTYEKEHLRKYKAEYYVTVRWKDKQAPKVVDVYIEPVYKSVTYRDTYKGVYYRPYDGKIRPKLWSEFESGHSYFNNAEEFEKGLIAAKIYRRMFYIADWYKEMNESQRENVDRIIADIKAGTPVTILEEAKEEREQGPLAFDQDIIGEEDETDIG